MIAFTKGFYSTAVRAGETFQPTFEFYRRRRVNTKKKSQHPNAELKGSEPFDVSKPDLKFPPYTFALAAAGEENVE